MATQTVKVNLLEFPFEQRPHEYVQLAQQYLNVHPEAPLVRLRLIGAYAQLGCRELAAEQWQCLPASVKNQTGGMRRQIMGMGEEVVRIDRPTARFKANFDAARRFNPQLDALDLDALFSQISDAHVIRCRRGGYQVKLPGREEWLDGFRDHRADGQLIRFPAEWSGGPFPGLIVCPLGQGHTLRRAHGLTGQGYVGAKAPLYVLEPDARALVLTFCLEDLRDQLGDPRVRVFVGPDCLEQLKGWLLAEPNWPVPSQIVSSPVGRGRMPAGIDEALSQVNAGLRGRLLRAAEKLADLYADRDAVYWAERLAEAPLRIMALTSRFTTVLQYTLEALLGGFGQLGHETHMIREATDHERNSGEEFLEECLCFQPDMVLLADGTRSGLPLLPKGLPVVSWMQDRLPRLLSSDVGRSVGPLDLVVGMFKLELTSKYDYPFQQYYSMPLLADTEAMRREHFSDEALAAYRCDVSYISHQSQAPEAIRDEILAQMGPQARDILKDVYERMRALYEEGGAIYFEADCHRFVAEVEKEHGSGFDRQYRSELLWHLWHRLNNGFYRHQVLEWVADRGVDLRLYGSGWEKHPRLGRFGRGPVGHDQVGAVCRSSRVNLQVVPYGAIHHRMLNGMAAGGFFLLRWHPSDEMHRVEIPLWERICKLGIKDMDELRRCGDEEIRRLMAEYEKGQRLDTSAPLIQPDQVLSVLRIAAESEFRFRTCHVFPHLGELMFRDRKELGRLLECWLGDEGRRTAMIRKQQGALEQLFSYRRGAQDILQTLRDHMAGAGRRES